LAAKNTHDRLLRDLVNGSDAAFVFVNYKPSPEAQFPIGAGGSVSTRRETLHRATDSGISCSIGDACCVFHKTQISATFAQLAAAERCDKPESRLTVSQSTTTISRGFLAIRCVPDAGRLDLRACVVHCPDRAGRFVSTRDARFLESVW